MTVTVRKCDFCGKDITASLSHRTMIIALKSCDKNCENRFSEEEYELTIVFKSETPFYEIGSFLINNLLDKFENLQMWKLKRRQDENREVEKCKRLNMEFQKERCFTALNADELKVGSKVIVEDNLFNLKESVLKHRLPKIIKVIELEDCEHRFLCDDGFHYAFAYLVEELEENE